jgi:hypothetical protein
MKKRAAKKPRRPVAVFDPDPLDDGSVIQSVLALCVLVATFCDHLHAAPALTKEEQEFVEKARTKLRRIYAALCR